MDDVIRCCGSCKRFSSEDLDGFGLCWTGTDYQVMRCDDCCDGWIIEEDGDTEKL